MKVRVLKAVLLGFGLTSALILSATWAFDSMTGSNAGGDFYTPTLAAALMMLVYTSAATVAGAYVAARIDETGTTTTGFTVGQLFFGFGMVREFWLAGAYWYTIAAMILVIPCAIAGRSLARRLRSSGALLM